MLNELLTANGLNRAGSSNGLTCDILDDDATTI